MSFVDEATVTIQAGNGGNGSCSFRREKFIPFGGPDGGDGGKGGDIVFQADTGLNTLVDFRYIRKIAAEHGDCGHAQQCAGRGGDDKIIRVPVGTMITNEDTGVSMGDLDIPGKKLILASGGKGGLGNIHFKSSTNRAPTRTTPGIAGERFPLKLELRVLADVGLLGFPNAGKSTLIRAISAAKPKVADYPFTTLKPHLGVVRLGPSESFVVADIPGLIEGASDGIGLGHQFLRHVSRTQLLLHIVDVMPMDGSSPSEAAKTIVSELASYGQGLVEKTRWIVLNKMDTVPQEDQETFIEAFREELKWTGPLFAISAIGGKGTDELCQKIGQHLTHCKELVEEEAEEARRNAL